MANLPLSDSISQTSNMRRNYRIIETEFGDGYSIRAGDGINTRRDHWTVVWEHLTSTERDTVLDALETAGGVELLDWQAPGYDAARSFRTVGDIVVEPLSGNIYNVSVELREEFDLTA